MKDLNGTKIDLSNDSVSHAERNRILEIIKKLGYAAPSAKDKPYAFICDNTHTSWTEFQDYFDDHEYREITINDLERLLVEVSIKVKMSLNFTKIDVYLLDADERKELLSLLTKLNISHPYDADADYFFITKIGHTGSTGYSNSASYFNDSGCRKITLQDLRDAVPKPIKPTEELINMHDSYQTVDGRKVRIIATDLKSSNPVAAAITYSNGFEQLTLYNATGGLYIKTKTAADLVKVKKKYKVTVVTNVYLDGTTSIHYTKDGADSKARGYPKKRVAVLVTEQEVEEGHGL